jgi:uncharacterized membrane protein
MAPRTINERLGWAVHVSLLTGLVISGALLILGATLSLASREVRPGQRPPGVRTIASQAMQGNGSAILYLGILILMLTPILRVLVLAIGWLLEKEWRFAAIALCVLALLATSVVLGTG